MLIRKAIPSALLMLLFAGVQTAHAGTSTGSPSEPFAKKTIYNCASGYERLLPGEYYGCRAIYHLQRKHYGQMMGTLEEAAHWANKDAQYALGMIYLDGKIPGIPANRPMAIAWLALAAERKDPTYFRTYSAVCLQSTPAEIRSGGALYRKMRLEYSDKVAGKLAIHRFNREIKPIDDAARSGGLMWLDGFSEYPESGITMLVKLHGMADEYFDGMTGTVTVGKLPSKFSNVQPPTPPTG